MKRQVLTKEQKTERKAVRKFNYDREQERLAKTSYKRSTKKEKSTKESVDTAEEKDFSKAVLIRKKCHR